MLRLNTIRKQPGSTKNTKRLGRGIGSGQGKTAGKGHKGQLARKGKGKPRRGFEGGQTPFYRRIPKKGFKSLEKYTQVILNLTDLSRESMKSMSTISLETLKESGHVKGRFDRLVVLGTGNIDRAVTIHAHRVSEAASEKIAKAGGKVELLTSKVSS